MKKTLNLMSLVLILTWAILILSTDAEAGIQFVPGDTEDEYIFNLELLQNTDETEVAESLTNEAPSIREAACMRLKEIGTSGSLVPLYNVATNQTEEPDVRKIAAYAYWIITHREDIKSGNTGEGVLIDIVSNTTGDETITPEVMSWAIDSLGNMGSSSAVPHLEAIRDSRTETPYSAYLKERAIEALIKIDFIDTHTPGEYISEGLAHEELCIRKWAVRYLVGENPDDLLDQLNTIYNDAITNGDSGLATYVAMLLSDESRKNRRTSIEILTPQDGITVKTPRILVTGYVFLKGEEGPEPFSDIIDLTEGENTYTKEVTDTSGTTVSESLTIYFENQYPILDPIGDKQLIEGQPVTFNISATEPDGDNLLYFVGDIPDGAAFDYDTLTFSWLSPAVGTYTVLFRVRDGWGLNDDEEVTITVTPRPPYGDISGDGQITVEDAFMVGRGVIGITTLTQEQLLAADVNGDGRVSAADVILIGQYALGLITEFPVEG